MKICFNEATAMGCSTLIEDVSLCDAVGFEAIELRIDMLKAFLQNHSREDALALFENRRIRPVNLNAVYPYEALFSAQDTKERQAEFLKDFQFACDMAQYLGANALVLCPPLKADRITPFENSADEQIEMNVRIVSRLAAIAKETDTQICFEIVGARYSSCRNIPQAKIILDAVSMPNVGLTIDSYNLYLDRQDNTFSEIGLLRPEEIFVAHINDAEFVPHDQIGDQSKRCFCGRGILDLRAYLAALKAIGYDDVMSIETFRPEYWKGTAQSAITEAYNTTRDALKQSDCL